MNKNDQWLLAETFRGAKLIFENAKQLYDEAETLGMKGALSRAVCLHQISIEECSKIDILGAAATGLLMGQSVDLANLARAMRRHQVKNFSFAYRSRCSPAEREAYGKGDHEEALKIFRQQQKAIHDWLNTNKNASLYVDFVDGKFVAPTERITEELTAVMHLLNREQLGAGEIFVGLLGRMIAEPDKQGAIVQDALRRLQAAPPDQLPKALMAWLDQAKSSFGGDNGREPE